MQFATFDLAAYAQSWCSMELRPPDAVFLESWPALSEQPLPFAKEGSMDNENTKLNSHFSDDLPQKLEFENSADTTGMWFAAAILFAVLAAGIIVYRTANTDAGVMRTATADNIPASVRTDPMWPSTVIPAR
jgi:hypothetical protein